MKRNPIQAEKELQRNRASETTAVRFLGQRDFDFDTAKSFLVVSMIFAHGFQWFWTLHYNRNLTYYVIFGFVFLSGLTVGSIYLEKLLAHPIQYSWAVVSRGLKLLGLFLLANALIIPLRADRLTQALNLRPTQLLVAVLRGDHRGILSFVILVSIGFTFLFCIALLCWRKRPLDLLLLGLGIGALWAIQLTGDFDFYVPTMTIVGLVGVLLAKLLISLNWERTKTTLLKWLIALWVGYAAYQATLLVSNEGASYEVGHYLNVTVVLLSAVYLTSYRFGLTNYRLVGLLNRTLAKHMLFAYLFHLLFLNVLAIFIRRGNFNFYEATAICLFTLTVTVLSALSVDVLTKRYETLNTVYSLGFR